MSLFNDGKETLKKAKIFEWIKKEIDKISLTLYLFQVSTRIFLKNESFFKKRLL